MGSLMPFHGQVKEYEACKASVLAIFYHLSFDYIAIAHRIIGLQVLCLAQVRFSNTTFGDLNLGLTFSGTICYIC